VAKKDRSALKTDQAESRPADAFAGPFPLRSLPLWPVCTAVLVVFIAVYLLTQNLFILVEGRTYFVNAGFVSGITASRYWLFPAGSNTRFTSMMFASLVNHTCGVSVTCTNTWEAELVALAFGAIAIHTFQLIGSLRLTLFVAGLWVLSAPGLSGVLWQSIQHDKIALILTILTLTLAVEFFSRRDRPRWADALFSVVLTGLFGVAFNAKEVAFLLPICVSFLAVVLALRGGGSVLRNLQILALPVVYSAWYIGYYFAHLGAAWSHHIASGSPLEGIETLILVSLSLGNFFSLGQWGPYSREALAIAKPLYVAFAGIVAALALFRARKWRRSRTGFIASLPNAILGRWRELYLLLILSVSLAAFARTKFPSAFYMMIPFWAGTLLVILVLRFLVADMPHSRVAFGLLLLLMAAPLLVSYSTHFAPGGAVPRLLQGSRSLEFSFETVRALLPAPQVKAVRITVAGTPDSRWYLLTGARGESLDADLGPYIFDDLSSRPVMIDGDDPVNTAKPRVPGEADIRLAEDYSLMSISFDGQTMFRRTGSSAK
jgi:hypothetical protein